MSAADKHLIKATNMYMTSEEESPTQVQQRNIREAEMLTSNLGEGFISHQEILSEIGVLKELAILQESMVCINTNIALISFHIRIIEHIVFARLGMVFSSDFRVC